MNTKILIVDDEPDAVEYVKAIVSEIADFTLITANDGKECLEKAKEEQPDLIILDVMMPEMTGFEVFDALRRDSKTVQTPVIMLTGVSEESGIKFGKADMGGFFGKEPEDFIDKPVAPERLQESVKAALKL